MVEKKMSLVEKIISGTIIVGLIGTLGFGLEAHKKANIAYKSLLNNDQITAQMIYGRKEKYELLSALSLITLSAVVMGGGYVIDLLERRKKTN